MSNVARIRYELLASAKRNSNFIGNKLLLYNYSLHAHESFFIAIVSYFSIFSLRTNYVNCC